MFQQHITDLATYELKVESFSHENIGQLNSYIGYYKQHEMSPGDSQPIGLLLRAEKNEALVEYALSGLTNQLFVSKYELQLPKKNEIKSFLKRILQEMEGIDDIKKKNEEVS